MSVNEKMVTLGAMENLAEKLKEELPVNVSQLNNDSGFQTAAQVAAAVAASDHLTRKKVAGLDAIDPATEGADKYIYMVPKTDSEEDDLYDEYMVLDGKVEHVGSTKVDLSGYQQKEAGKGLSSNDFTDAEKAKLAGLEVASEEEVNAMLERVFGS